MSLLSHGDEQQDQPYLFLLEILRVEQENGSLHGVIVQFGGQTPLKLANALEEEGIPILGTTPDAIDLAEDREER